MFKIFIFIGRNEFNIIQNIKAVYYIVAFSSPLIQITTCYKARSFRYECDLDIPYI
jgi:hypothetical protein